MATEKEINQIADEVTTLTDDAYMVADNDMGVTPTTVKILWSNIKAMLVLLFAPIAKGVTNGDSHNHLGGDGGTIAHTSLGTISTDDHHAKTVVADDIHAATGKTTPVDADELGIVDSAASNVLKKLTWANLKATLKTYFDTLYTGGAGGAAPSYALNGGFDFAERQTPGTLTTIADNKYSADQWRVTRENADVQYIRVDALGETGLTSQYYGQIKKITAAGKLHVMQPLEGMNSVAFRGVEVTFQIKMKSSAARDMRMAVLELQNAGTIDTIPATLVTAFNIDGTDPTLATNVAVITAAETKAITTSWATYDVTVTVPSNSKNLMLAIWSDDDVAANDTISFAEADFFAGASTRDWTTRLTQQEFDLLLRYCFRLESGAAYARYMVARADTTSTCVAIATFPTPMRIVPSLIVSAVGDFAVGHSSGEPAVTAIGVDYTSEKILGLKVTVGTTPFTTNDAVELIDDGGNSSWMYLEAGL